MDGSCQCCGSVTDLLCVNHSEEAHQEELEQICADLAAASATLTTLGQDLRGAHSEAALAIEQRDQARAKIDTLTADLDKAEAVVKMVRRAHAIGVVVLEEGDEPSISIPSVGKLQEAEARIAELETERTGQRVTSSHGTHDILRGEKGGG